MLIFHAVGDFDGDGNWEAAAVYRLNEELLIAAYRYNGWAWVETDQWRCGGYAIHSFYTAPSVTRGNGSHSLVIGWQQQANSYLSVYEWVNGRLREINRYAFAQESRSDAGYPPARSVGLYPAPVRTVDGTRWGFVDNAGKLVVPAEYDYAFGFQDNGLAIVGTKGKQGVINQTGQFVAQPVYDYINPFSEGLAVVSTSGGAGVINEAGKVITPKKYLNISSYSDGRALFTVSRNQDTQLYGYLNKEGREAIPARFRQGTDFTNGKAVVQVGDKEYQLIDREGRKLASYPFAFVGPLSEGLLAYQEDTSGKYGYINEQGTVVIPLRFTGAQPFQEGRAVVNTAENYGNQYGIIDQKGDFVVQPSYADVRLLGEGRAALGKSIDPAQPFIGSVYAIADLDGKLLTDFVYTEVEDFSGGYASVSNGRETFFIDPTGKRAAGLPAVSGAGTLAFDGNLIRANVDNRLSYLDRSGRVVWAQNTEISLTPPYRVLERKYKPNKDYLVYYPQIDGMANKGAQEEANKRLAELSQVKPVDPNAQLEASYTGDFQVAFFRKKLLELQLDGYSYPFGAAHGNPTRVYTHTDLDTGTFYQLPDLFKPGSDYIKVISDIIGEQIRRDPQYSYVWLDSYKGIAKDQLFHLSPNALHIFFSPYEIAPYAAGFPEFIVPFSQINSILDKKGAFWKSFY